MVILKTTVMKLKIILLLFVIGTMLSCSSDKDNEGGSNSIVGIWDLTELKINESTASDEAKFGRDMLNYLSARNCYILTINFKSDLSLVTESKGGYVEVNVGEGGTGLDIPCPTQKDTETTAYTYASGVLTVLGDNSETVTVNVSISGNTMTINAADLDIENFNDSGQLIFKRR